MSKKWDKVWMWYNRTPTKPWMIYLSMNIGGIFLGVSIAVSWLGVWIKVWWIPLTLIPFGFFMFWLMYRYDKKRGYVDAAYKVYLDRREEVRRKLENE